MPIEIIRNDITKMQVDAIVNAANESLLGGGGVDGAIHRAAGPQLLAECRTLGGCKTGDAKITGGYRMKCKYIIHTVGPVWRGGRCGEENLLASCYRRSLELAREHGCESIAFPLISTGVYRYPKDQALRVAMDTIRDFVMEHDMLVYIVVFDKLSVSVSGKLFKDIAQYIDDHYVDEHVDREFENRRFPRIESERRSAETFDNFFSFPSEAQPAPAWEETDFAADALFGGWPDTQEQSSMCSLEDLFQQIDESFTQMLLRKIDEKGISDAACYKRANLSRKLFSKIRSDVHYKPSKRTAIALGIALELPLNEMKDLLMKAGYALSHSNRFDIIIEYFIVQGKYDIFEINETLFCFDQPLLGA